MKNNAIMNVISSYIYNGIIFPSLNVAKSCHVISSWRHNQQVVQQWANHMRNDLQRGRAVWIIRGQCQLFCAKLHYDAKISTLFAPLRLEFQGPEPRYKSIRSLVLGVRWQHRIIGIRKGLIRKLILYCLCWKHYKYKEWVSFLLTIFSMSFYNQMACQSDLGLWLQDRKMSNSPHAKSGVMYLG